MLREWRGPLIGRRTRCFRAVRVDDVLMHSREGSAPVRVAGQDGAELLVVGIVGGQRRRVFVGKDWIAELLG